MEETVKSCVLEVLNLTKLWTPQSKMLCKSVYNQRCSKSKLRTSTGGRLAKEERRFV